MILNGVYKPLLSSCGRLNITVALCPNMRLTVLCFNASKIFPDQLTQKTEFILKSQTIRNKLFFVFLSVKTWISNEMGFSACDIKCMWHCISKVFTKLQTWFHL